MTIHTSLLEILYNFVNTEASTHKQWQKAETECLTSITDTIINRVEGMKARHWKPKSPLGSIYGQRNIGYNDALTDIIALLKGGK